MESLTKLIQTLPESLQMPLTLLLIVWVGYQIHQRYRSPSPQPPYSAEEQLNQFMERAGMGILMKRNLLAHAEKYSYAIRLPEWRFAYSHLAFHQDGRITVNIKPYDKLCGSFVYYVGLAFLVAAAIFVVLGTIYDPAAYPIAAEAFAFSVAVAIMQFNERRSYIAAQKIKKHLELSFH